MGRTSPRRQRQPPPPRVRPQEHGLRRRPRRLRRPRIQGDAEQRRSSIQTFEVGAANEHRDRLVRSHTTRPLPHRSCRFRALARVFDEVNNLVRFV